MVNLCYAYLKFQSTFISVMSRGPKDDSDMKLSAVVLLTLCTEAYLQNVMNVQ